MNLQPVPIGKVGEILLQLYRTGGDEPRTALPQSRLTASQVDLLKRLDERKHAARKKYGRRTPVLLLHGASASRDTFLFPPGASLTDFLIRYTNLEPWLLDWRGSKNVTDGDRGSALKKVFTFDDAAEQDIPAALRMIRCAEGNAELPIRAVGHCMGAAVLSRAIAGGILNDDLRPADIVLSTIGLFFEVAVDGRLKAQDRLLERLWSDGDTRLIDPRCKSGAPRNVWPEELEKMYSAWPDWFKPHRNAVQERKSSRRGSPDVLETCNRLSFMYGEPYYEPALTPQIHASKEELADQFGSIPLQMYLHAVQSVRRGWIAKFESEEDVDSAAFVHTFISPAAREHFDGMNITLITGALNRLWHRDSVDRMYEWLLRDGGRATLRRCEKIIFRRNGHQDLLWGTNSWTEVFPRIADGLTALDDLPAHSR
jgi:hypothetical protein